MIKLRSLRTSNALLLMSFGWLAIVGTLGVIALFEAVQNNYIDAQAITLLKVERHRNEFGHWNDPYHSSIERIEVSIIKKDK